MTSDVDVAARDGRLGRTRVGVLTITRPEFDAAREVFGTRRIAGGRYHASLSQAGSHEQAGSYEYVLRQASDRGNTPASEATKEMVEDFRPQVVLLMGTAGGISTKDGLRLGDVVVPSYVHYSEVQKVTDGKRLARYIPFDHPSVLFRETYARAVLDDEDWHTRVSRARPRGKGWPQVHLDCSLVAGEKIWGDPNNDEQIKMLAEFQDASAIDMESMGVARAVFAVRRDVNYNLLYGIVRGVSDLVDKPNNNSQREKWTAYASEAAAVFAHNALTAMLEHESALSKGSES